MYVDVKVRLKSLNDVPHVKFKLPRLLSVSVCQVKTSSLLSLF